MISYGGLKSAKFYACFYGGKNKHCAPGLRFFNILLGKSASPGKKHMFVSCFLFFPQYVGLTVPMGIYKEYIGNI